MEIDIELLRSIGYFIGTICSYILSVYFLREYRSKKLRASLAWCLGFFFFATGQLIATVVTLYGPTKLSVLPGVLVVLLGCILFYYGAALLFFGAGSFFREKLTYLIFAIYLVYFAYVMVYFPPEAEVPEFFRLTVILGLITPIFLLVSLLFYRVGGRLSPGDPRKSTIYIVSVAWGLNFIGYIYLGLFWGDYPGPEAFVHILQGLAWILLLYGMALGKAARA